MNYGSSVESKIVLEHIIWRLYLEMLTTQDAQLAVRVHTLLQANRYSLLGTAIDFLPALETYITNFGDRLPSPGRNLKDIFFMTIFCEANRVGSVRHC